ncbi:hypothetical protein V7S43_007730 [Phytophthora oleae]|uniref:EF-hand domain-containing protein n=1 Tax=Phytophthora oleae TaxID=2107226 RepID=A0ABD3FPE8_9STRA
MLNISPTQPKVQPFASATDSTLHRPAWRSTRAIESSSRSSRRPPSRYRGQLRYDLLGPPLSAAVGTSSVESPVTNATKIPNRSAENEPECLSSTKQELNDAAASGETAKSDVQTSMTNLEELRWFQHRWLDKHGRNSNLKATREQLALIRRWFDSLDADGSGEVGLDELEDPLVSVGLAGSRDDVQHLIEEVDVNGTGGVTFEAFLNLLYPERVRRERNRRFPPPLHTPKHRPPARPEVPTGRFGTSPKTKHSSQVKANVVNPVARLFENLQAGKLGDLAIPFPVLITAYRRRMLLDAHMAGNPTTKRVGSSVLQALEATSRENSPADTYDWRRTHFDLQLPTLP